MTAFGPKRTFKLQLVMIATGAANARVAVADI